MEWFSQNWVWLLFVVGMLVMHMFGHGGHGGHGGHDSHDDRNDINRPESKSAATLELQKHSGHHH